MFDSVPMAQKLITFLWTDLIRIYFGLKKFKMQAQDTQKISIHKVTGVVHKYKTIRNDSFK